MIVKGYMDENAKAMKKVRDLEFKLKAELVKTNQMDKELNEYKLKNLKERKGIFIEESEDEVNITTNNLMGSGQSISLKQLQELRDTLKRLQAENSAFKRDQSNTTDTFKVQIEKLREEKSSVEK